MWRVLATMLVIVAWLGLVTGAQAAGASYVYDELGRLVQVIAPDGTSTQYTYDPAGNIRAVRADGTSLLAITSFFPEVAPVGAAVTITGSGFSATAASNTVKFNGVAATVSAATTTQLTVVVPTGATTGAISVANANGAVSSTGVFTVGVGQVPQIASFSPSLGNPGTVVTIAGQNFQTPASADHVAFNTTVSGVVSAATAASITTSVPSAGASGKITVSTAYGSGTSTADFLAVPPSITPASVLSWKRATVGGAAQTLAIGAVQSVGALIFDGTVNQLVSVDITGSSITPGGSAISYEVFGPQGTRVASGSLATSLPATTLPPLTAAGTYAIFFEPGTSTANLTVVLKSDASFAIDGGRYQIHGLFGGSTASVSFNGTAGQNLGLGLSGITFAGTNVVSAPLTLQVTLPNGSVWLFNAGCQASNPGGGCDLNLTTLPNTGTYTVQVLNPTGNSPIASASLTLSSDKAVTMTSGSALSLNLRTGQNGRPTFAGTAGQTPTLWFGEQMTTPTGQSVPVKVLNPDGSTATTLTLSPSAASTYVNLPALGSTGNYSVFFDPAYGAAASVQATLNPVATAVTVDSSPVTVTANGGGYASFSGTAGQNLGVGITALSFVGGVPASASLQVIQPDGSVWLSVPCATSNPAASCLATLPKLTTTGTYKLQMTAGSAVVSSFKVFVSNDLVVALTSGSSTTVNMRTGQNGRLTFSGTAGQSATIRFENIGTNPTGQAVTLTVLDPNGATIATAIGSQAGNGGLIYIPGLPSTGTYTVFVTTAYGAATGMAVKLNGLADIFANGSSVNITSAAPGYGTSLFFNGTKGQNLGLAINGVAFAGGAAGALSLNIIPPDGSSWRLSANCSTGNPGAACSAALPLGQTGPYLLQVNNSTSSAISGGSVTLSNDKAATLTPGTPYALSLVWGQNARLTFAGTAGQPATVRFAGMTTTPANLMASLTILDSAGNPVSFTARGSTSSNGGEAYVASLPKTDTYQVVMVPDYGAPTTAKVTLNPAMELPSDGTPVNITSSAGGYGTSLTFSGTKGQNLGLAINGVAFAGGAAGALSLNIIPPDGSSWGLSANCSTGNPGAACSAALPLGQTGTYLLQVNNSTSSAISGGSVTLSNDKAATLTPATPYALSLVWGQNARLTFAGTAGQPATVRFAGMTTTPANLMASLTILDSAGNPVSFTARGSSSSNGGEAYVAKLPKTDTYQVVMVPDYGAPTTATVTLNPAMELPVDGTPVNITSSAGGYGTSLTFSGTKGQNLGLAINGVAFAGGAAGALSLNIIPPDGSSWGLSANCSTGNPGAACSAALPLGQAGTYLLQVNNSTSSAISGGSVTLSNDKTATLTLNTPYKLDVRWGQNGRLTFTGTAASHTLNVGTPTTTPAGLSVGVAVYDALGNMVAEQQFSSAGSLSLGTLTTGTYTVVVVPSYGAPTSVTLTYQ